MAAIRRKPVARESAVPTATTALERSTEFSRAPDRSKRGATNDGDSNCSASSSGSCLRGPGPGGLGPGSGREDGGCTDGIVAHATPAPAVDVPAPPEGEERQRADHQDDAHAT